MGIENMNGGSWIEFNKLKGELRMDRARKGLCCLHFEGTQKEDFTATTNS